MKLNFNYVIINIIVLRHKSTESYNHIYFRKIETRKDQLRIVLLIFPSIHSVY